MLKTFFALVLSTGLVACVTDDDSIETEELAENPDVLPEGDDGFQVDPTGVRENPTDVPGRIPARSEGGSHVQIENQVTTDLNVVRGTSTVGTVTVEESAQQHTFARGVSGTNVGGTQVGHSCDGQDVACRTADPQLLVY